MKEKFTSTTNPKLEVQNQNVEAVTNLIMSKIKSKEIAYQFILEELEGATLGNEAATRFVKESGIDPSEFKGALLNSIPEVDGEGGPQQTLISFSMKLSSDTDRMVKFRVDVVDKIMEHYSFGKYAK